MALKQNIIYIYFKGKHLVTSKSQYQYNHGQFLYFADLDLPQAFEVHFSNKDKGYSKPKVGSNKLVEIPDEYYWSGAQMIYAWIYLHSDIDDGETVYEVRIPLIKRAEPTDEQPLPQQESAMERAIAELNTAVEITTENANKTGEDRTQVSDIRDEVVDLKEDIDATAETVTQKAQDAIDASRRSETSAQNAAEFEEGARNYSEEAKQSAQEALESKNTAKQKADVATDASAEALGYRNDTRGYKDEALGAKNDIQILKGQIDETANDIEEISDAVYGNARVASQSANSASQSALSASQSANSASQSASQAEQFKDQSEANVTHYPKVINGYWYVWDATNEEYVNTNVDARGIKGDTGESGVYIGTEEPTDESVDVWIDTDENADDVVTDVQVNGTSVVNDSVAEIPIANSLRLGVVKANYLNGISVKNDGNLIIYPAGSSSIKNGTNENYPLNAKRQHESVFYGLAKASGTDEKDSELPVGQYTEEAKASIKNMLGVDVKKDDVYDTYVTDTATGRISTFEDGADDVPIKSLTVTLEPQQDFNGYDKPWVGGGGINLNPREWVSESTSATNRYYIVSNLSLTAGTYYVRAEISDGNAYVVGLYMSIDGGSNNRIGDNGSTPIVRNFTLENDAVVSIYLHCSTTPDGVQARSSVSRTQIDEFIPYENICPITGHTGFNLYRTGGNLICKTLPEDAFVCGSIGTGDTTIQSGSLYRAYCVYVGKNTVIRYKKEGTSSFTVGLAFADEYITEREGSVIYGALNMANRNNNTLNSGEHPYLVIVVAKSSVDNQTFNTRQVQTFFKTDNGDPIRYSPTRNIDKYLYDWEEEAGTVYGCTLDVLTGVLYITKAIVDAGTRTMTATDASKGLFAFSLPNGLVAGSTGTTYEGLCDGYKFTTTGYNETHVNEDGVIWMYEKTANARIRDSRFIGYTIAQAKEALRGVMISYPLATPIEVQLEPHDLASILGGNQIWVDNGVVDIEYRADTKLYVNKKITEAISALT